MADRQTEIAKTLGAGCAVFIVAAILFLFIGGDPAPSSSVTISILNQSGEMPIVRFTPLGAARSVPDRSFALTGGLGIVEEDIDFGDITQASAVRISAFSKTGMSSIVVRRAVMRPDKSVPVWHSQIDLRLTTDLKFHVSKVGQHLSVEEASP